jgi:oleandomycin transport system ATP-binding protein
MDNTIETHGLVKRFGDTTALDGVDLAARTGSVLAVLGPNGAGKTTAIRILATLLEPDEGRALVGGYDVVAQAQQVRRLIALTGQYAAVDESLTGIENLLLIGRLLGQSRAAARGRAAELLAQFGLADAGGRAVKTYSGGMRRRLDLAASLVGRPRVLYLDEPTTGLDPRARSGLWEVVRALTSDGVTVLLTTQYMEEADQLADDVVVIDRGRVVAVGTPGQLKAQVGRQVLTVSPVSAADVPVVAGVVTDLSGAAPRSPRRRCRPSSATRDCRRRCVGDPVRVPVEVGRPLQPGHVHRVGGGTLCQQAGRQQQGTREDDDDGAPHRGYLSWDRLPVPGASTPRASSEPGEAYQSGPPLQVRSGAPGTLGGR